MKRFIQWLAAFFAVVTLVACGGGGGDSGTSSDGSGSSKAPAPAAIELFASNSQMSSASNSSVTFTVVVKDGLNQVIPNQTVTFSASSGNLSGTLPTPTTGAAGEPITGVTLSPGTDQSNRTIVVTARAGGVTKTISVDVIGSGLTVSGETSVLLGAGTSFTVKAQDQSGKPIAGTAVSVSSALGNAISPATLTTDAQGVATFSYTGTNGGVDTLTVNGLGIKVQATVLVSSEDFKFEKPAANASLPVNAIQAITVRILSGGVPVAGRKVTFSTTRGVITSDTVNTGADGRASTTLTSATAGPAKISAQTSNGQVTASVNFVATQATSLVLQANPAAVPPNAGGSTANQITLQATVRDAANNPVANQVVNFTALADASNGTISPGSGVTDANGQVSVQFIPGGLTTASKGVMIRATVQGTSVSGTTAVTVSGQALFISIASSNVISNVTPTTYQKEFSVYVTDANGAPAVNRAVTLSVTPTGFAKGQLDNTGTGTVAWEPSIFNACNYNEDANNNGILDPGEDKNGDSRLQPGLPVTVSPGNVVTDANGFANFSLQYGENYAWWVTTLITARASVGGTESSAVQSYYLTPLASDVADESVSPANVISPFGVGQCTDAF